LKGPIGQAAGRATCNKTENRNGHQSDFSEVFFCLLALQMEFDVCPFTLWFGYKKLIALILFQKD
jgi:hypothetical protein